MPFPPFSCSLPARTGRDQRGTSSNNLLPPSPSPNHQLPDGHSLRKPHQHLSQAWLCHSVLSLQRSGSRVTKAQGFVSVPGAALLQTQQTAALSQQPFAAGGRSDRCPDPEQQQQRIRKHHRPDLGRQRWHGTHHASSRGRRGSGDSFV